VKLKNINHRKFRKKPCVIIVKSVYIFIIPIKNLITTLRKTSGITLPYQINVK